MSPRQIVLYCGLLLTVTAFSVDITLPAFGYIADDLKADYGLVQWIVPIFVFSAGFGQLFAGPLSDRFGRKPIVLIGLAIYSAGAIICQFAPSIEVLLAGRVLQGLGASAGRVLGPAIIRDLFVSRELARNIALATMIFALGPIVAPLVGVSIMALGTWRLIFLAITAFGIMMFLVGWLALPESNSNKNREATNPRILWKNATITLSHPQSRFYLLMAGPIMAQMLIILVIVPRIYKEEFGVEGTMFALLFALHGIGIIIGQIANRHFLSVYQIGTVMKAGAAVLFTTMLVMLGLDQAGLMNAYVLTACLIGFATGFMVVMGNATALALDPHGEIAGFVSSLFGFTSQFISALAAMAVASFVRGDLSAFIWVLVVLSGGVFSVLLFGDPARKNVLKQ